MEISPYMLMLLTVYSFIFGMSAGAFNDVNRIIRCAFGVKYSQKAFKRLYNLKLPFVGALFCGEEEKKLKKRMLGILIFFQDILWGIYIGCGTVILNYYLNRGQFRLYTIAAVAVGIGIYYFTVGRLVMLLSEAIIFFIKATFKISTYLLLHPFVLVGKALFACVRNIYKKIGLAIEKKKNIRYNKKEQEWLISLADKGFLNDSGGE